MDIGSGPGYVNRQIPADYSVLAMDIDESILKGNIRQTCVGDIMDIPLADFNANLVAATQFRIINNSGSAINVFIDNLYTYGDDNTSVNPDDPTAPATSAPAPEHPEEDVVSLFSDAYETTLSLSQTHPGEPSSQMEVIDLSEGDQAIRFTGMNWTLVGINPAANLEGMEWIHFDVYAINTQWRSISFATTSILSV